MMATPLKALLLIVPAVSVVNAAFICETDQYLDKVTRTCTYCSEICDLADLKRTADECARKCPNYVTAKTTQGQGNIVASPATVATTSAAILTTTQVDSESQEDGKPVDLVFLLVSAGVILAIAALIGTLIYLRKCCCQSEPCAKDVMQRCYQDEDKKNGDKEEGLPLDENTQKKTYQPHANDSNKVLLPSGAANAVEKK